MISRLGTTSKVVALLAVAIAPTEVSLRTTTLRERA